MNVSETFSAYRSTELGGLVESGAKRFLKSKAASVVAAIGIASTVFDTNRTADAINELNLRESMIRTFYMSTETLALGGYAWTMAEARKKDFENPLIPLSPSQSVLIEPTFSANAAA